MLMSLVAGGLLHSVPKHEGKKTVQNKIMAALRECVEETEPGGRIKAADNLADLITVFIKLHEGVSIV